MVALRGGSWAIRLLIGLRVNPENPFYGMDQVPSDGEPINPLGSKWVDTGLAGFLEQLAADPQWRARPYVTPSPARDVIRYPIGTGSGQPRQASGSNAAQRRQAPGASCISTAARKPRDSSAQDRRDLTFPARYENARMQSTVYRMGAIEIRRIDDVTLDLFHAASFFPMRADDGAAPAPSAGAGAVPDGERLVLQVHGWLVRGGGRTVLVDTGAGSHKHRPHARQFHEIESPYLQRLAETRVAPDEVDYVLTTHLHVDHVGWNTRLEGGVWVPTFRKARYLFSRREFEFFTDPLNHVDNDALFLPAHFPAGRVLRTGDAYGWRFV